MASRDLFLRKDWWAKRKDRFLDPSQTPRQVNLASLVDPWPGTIEQFRALFYREAKAANLYASTTMLNEVMIEVNVMLRNAQEDEERKQLLRRKLGGLPADIFVGQQEPEYQPDPRCNCGAEDDKSHAPSCGVWFTPAQFRDEAPDE